MMGVSLFGTCTMKYNPRLATQLAARPEIAELHPDQDDETLQGVLELVHGLDLILRGVSGMDAFVFQAGGGAHAAYTHAAITRAYHAARGELDQRDEIVTTIQAHPCNAATAHAAGFNIVTLPLEENGYPSLDALKAAVSDRTAVAHGEQPRRHGRLQPRDRRRGSRSCTMPAGCASTITPTSTASWAGSGRASSASTPACTCCTRPSARRRVAEAPRSAPTAARRSWRASCPPLSSCGTVTATASTTTARAPSARCASSGATCRSSSTRTPGVARWGQTGSSSRPTSRCSRTTTWRSACSRSAA